VYRITQILLGRFLRRFFTNLVHIMLYLIRRRIIHHYFHHWLL